MKAGDDWLSHASDRRHGGFGSRRPGAYRRCGTRPAFTSLSQRTTSRPGRWQCCSSTKAGTAGVAAIPQTERWRRRRLRADSRLLVVRSERRQRLRAAASLDGGRHSSRTPTGEALGVGSLPCSTGCFPTPFRHRDGMSWPLGPVFRRRRHQTAFAAPDDHLWVCTALAVSRAVWGPARQRR
jgi:hypothetical protein